MNKILTFIGLVLLMIFSISLVQASINVYTYDGGDGEFDLIGSATPLEMCQCANSMDSIRITNLGTITVFYKMSSNLDNLVFSENLIALAPGESKDITYLITAKCDVKGEANYTIRVDTNVGTSKVITKKLSINKCQNIQAQLYSNTNTVEPCSRFDFDIDIKNPSQFSDEYRISADKYSEYISFSTDKLNILPQATNKIKASAKLPCDINGNITIPIKITTKNNKLEANIGFDLNVKDNYNYSVIVDNKEFNNNTLEFYSCYEKDETLIPVTIKNNMHFDNEYKLNLDSDKLFNFRYKLLNNSIKVKANSEETIYIAVKGEGKEKYIGYYNLTLKVIDKFGKTETIVPIQSEIAKCYDANIEFYGKDYQFCSGNNNLGFEIKNTGKFKQEFMLNIEPSEELQVSRELSKTYVELNPGQTETIDLYYKGGFEYSKNIADILHITSTDGNVDKKEAILINTKTSYDCNLLKVYNLKDKYDMNYEDNENISFTIMNAGLKGDLYNVTLEGNTDLLKYNGFDSIYLNPWDTQDFKFELDKKDILPSTYYYNLKLTSSVGNDYNFKFSIDLDKKSKLEKFGEFIADNWLQILGIILVVVAIILLIMFAPMVFFILLIVGWIIGSIMLFNMAGLPTQNDLYPALNESTNPLTYVKYCGDDINLDLSKFFDDPDLTIDDSLRFNYSASNENIRVEIEEDGKTVVGCKDQGGYFAVVFSAEDNYGEIANSDIFIFDLRNKPTYTVKEWMWIYRAPLFVLFGFILLLLLYPLFSKYKKEENNDKNNIDKETMLKNIDSETDNTKLEGLESKKKKTKSRSKKSKTKK